MKRIVLAIAGSLIGASAFAANYGGFQPKTADFNNGELATYPAQVQGAEPMQHAALSTVSPQIGDNTELAAHPLVPNADGMMNQASRQDNMRLGYRHNSRGSSMN